MADAITLTWYFFLFVGWWLIPLVGLFLYRKKLMQFPVECIIYEKRGENLVFTRDVAGRFEEPVTHYKLKISKDTIPIPQYDWLLQNTSKPTNFFEKIANMLAGKQGTITLFKYGSKQYKPIDVTVGDKVVRKFKEVKDSKGNSKWITVYHPINVRKEMSRLDFDVIDWDDMNHMTQELRAIDARRSPVKAFFEKYGAVVGLAAVTLVFIIALYYAYQLNTEAADRLIAAAGQQAQQPVQVPSDGGGNPLSNFIPGK